LEYVTKPRRKYWVEPGTCVNRCVTNPPVKRLSHRQGQAARRQQTTHDGFQVVLVPTVDVLGEARRHLTAQSLQHDFGFGFAGSAGGQTDVGPFGMDQDRDRGVGGILEQVEDAFVDGNDSEMPVVR
jgi:hypothetical protein